MRKRFTACALAALASGCAVPTTGVVPRAEGMYTVTRQGSSAMVSPTMLTAQASEEGTAYCQRQGRRFMSVHVKEIPAGPFGRWPESEVLFRCE